MRRWSRSLIQARTIGAMSKKDDGDAPEPDNPPGRRSDEELGAFLRREGLHEAELDAALAQIAPV